MTTLEELQLALDAVAIRDPLRTLINPSFELVDGLEGIRLTVYIDSIDAVTSIKLTLFQASFPLGEYYLLRKLKDPINMGKFVHRCLVEFLAHETSESVLVNGQFAITPIHWGPDPILQKDHETIYP